MTQCIGKYWSAMPLKPPTCGVPLLILLQCHVPQGKPSSSVSQGWHSNICNEPQRFSRPVTPPNVAKALLQSSSYPKQEEICQAKRAQRTRQNQRGMFTQPPNSSDTNLIGFNGICGKQAQCRETSMQNPQDSKNLWKKEIYWDVILRLAVIVLWQIGNWTHNWACITRSVSGGNWYHNCDSREQSRMLISSLEQSCGSKQASGKSLTWWSIINTLMQSFYGKKRLIHISTNDEESII